MKLPFHGNRSPLVGARPRSDATGFSVRDRSDAFDRGHSSSHPDSRRIQTGLHPSTNDSGKNRLSNRIKLLNCGANKKRAEVEVEEYWTEPIPVARKKEPAPSWWANWQPPEESAIDISRPVLITVKDGDFPYSGDDKNNLNTEIKHSFMIGGPPPKNNNRVSFLRKPDPMPRSTSWNPFGQRSSSFKQPAKDTNDTMTAQELARKERWKKGLARHWQDDEDTASIISHHGEGSTISGSVTTGVTGYTGFDSTASAYTDYTTEEDDSYGTRHTGTSNLHRYPRVSHPERSPSYKYYETRRSAQGLWTGVAEDMGIIAGLLMSDGVACVGEVAEITGETVGSSCGAEKYNN